MPIKVVVVGYCASGKTTLVESLRAQGVDASAVAQEHSIIGDLWNHYSPDVVVFLDVSLDGIRERRDNPNWPASIFDLQTKRLESARKRADIVVDTTANDSDAALTVVLSYLDSMERQ